jgi:hypothetical protein
LEYEAGLIEEESTSELLRFTIRQILNQIGNDQIYHYLEQQEQKKAKSQQAIHQLSSQLTALETHQH